MTLKLKVITGSTRPGRVGPTVAKWAVQAAEANGKFEVEAVDLADMNLPLLDEANHPAMQKYEHEHTKRWSAIIGDADAFVFVTPEYDFFAPAALVNAVQVLLKEWKYKPAGVVSYGGISGGLRSAQVLRGLLGNVGAVAIPQGVPLPLFSQYISDDGTFTPNEKVTEGAEAMFDELARWAGALKPLHSPA
ncbi:NADPH-dependent oxidoreductase [Pseudooceanicola sediminis]|uniref:NADPH-dependent oxidoreductase n=1 Tax=Pseudooceanicola sediminis TaxID=2211117 RepID=A0A399IXF0_9RHOB|nr:NAD(P)H-dependent oxidoreductase [Pseudooceanicola sediminis]KAA2312960.1 NAD(P)H-dependent oxidoreductase [Puniceibacterium sp. HSS470]RII37640.1 NADPH-dependent oxidoreductase [Pseudooceanicola sediminis]|tara:strand:+ start:10011 stop:10583 length:573 start_codon:yes stop_codon:yes gene_type:complete